MFENIVFFLIVVPLIVAVFGRMKGPQSAYKRRG